MGKQDEIRNALKNFASTVGPANTMLATVKTINNDATIVLVDDDDLEYDAVRIRPVIDGKESITLKPKENTWCLAIRIEEDEEWMAIAFGEITGFKIKCGTTVFDMDENGVVFNQGNNDGLVKVTPLVQKINALEQSLNQLKTVFASWVVVPTDGGAALKATVATWAGASITPTTANELKNDKVKH